MLGRVMWMVGVRVMMSGHATHRAWWVEGHWIEGGHHGRGEEGRRWKRRGRRRRAREVDALEDCLTHLLNLGHQLLLKKQTTHFDPTLRIKLVTKCTTTTKVFDV